MKFQSFAFDARRPFRSSSLAEVNFQKALKKVAKMAGSIVDMHTDGATIIDERKMMQQLRDYAELLGPWAKRQSEKLLQQVSSSNKRAFFNKSKKIGESLNAIAESDVGAVALSILYEQVDLIKSLPLNAGIRAQEISARHIIEGTRAQPDPTVIKQLEKEMGMTEEVATNRAKLIARTETARANAAFTEARATAVGAQSYIWHTTMDGAERSSHAKMNGKKIKYSDPPTLKDGTKGHAGTFPNCRCWQEPVFEEE